MGSGMYFPILSIFYSIILLFTFIFKKHIDTLENKIYGKLIIINFLGLVLEMLCTVGSIIYDNYPIISNIIYKAYLIYIFAWFMLLTMYVFYISFEKKNNIKALMKKYNIFKMTLLIVTIVCAIVCCCLPINLFFEGSVRYTYGPSVQTTYYYGTACIIIWLIFTLMNFKNIKSKKYIPMFLCILGILGATIVQYRIPGLLIMTSMQTFITFVMYFTIENPDIKLINELNIAKTQAEKANNAKSEFLSSMSHEIRTPLNAVVGFSESIMEESVSDEVKEQAQYIVNASESLLEIVNGILDISKIEANKLEIINTEYSFKKLFDDLSIMSKSKLENKFIEFKYIYDESIPNVLYGDQTRIKQIILNLLTNSIKYTKEGWIEFKVSNIITGNKCRLIIDVEDTGIGIKKENVDKLFTKFERLQVEKNTTVEGTGLGLAITKKLVELMGGKITVQSTFGKGSKFTIILDQKIVKGKTIEESIVDEIKFNNLSKYKLMVVDDNMINLKVASRLLKNYKIVPIEVNTGQECIEKIKNKEKYDLILLDDMMPKMSGMETLKKLKEIDGFDIPVIALTANAISGMKEKYLDAGFNDYIAKPIDRKELNRVLNEYLKGDE